MAQDLIDRFTPLHTQPIAGAQIATWAIVGGHRALRFIQPGGTQTYFAGVLNSLYNSSGIRVTLVWHSPGVTAGMTFSIAFERQAAGIFDYSGSSFGTTKNLVLPAPAGANLAVYSSLDFSNSEIDGLLVLESYRLQIARLSDGVVQDAYLHRVLLQNLT